MCSITQPLTRKEHTDDRQPTQLMGRRSRVHFNQEDAMPMGGPGGSSPQDTGLFPGVGGTPSAQQPYAPFGWVPAPAPQPQVAAAQGASPPPPVVHVAASKSNGLAITAIVAAAAVIIAALFLLFGRTATPQIVLQPDPTNAAQNQQGSKTVLVADKDNECKWKYDGRWTLEGTCPEGKPPPPLPCPKNKSCKDDNDKPAGGTQAQPQNTGSWRPAPQVVVNCGTCSQPANRPGGQTPAVYNDPVPANQSTDARLASLEAWRKTHGEWEDKVLTPALADVADMKPKVAALHTRACAQAATEGQASLDALGCPK